MTRPYIPIYSVDRKRIYVVGQTIHLYQTDPLKGRPLLNSNTGLFTSRDIESHIRELFPDGLSAHGWQYMADRVINPVLNGQQYTPCNHAIEILFENVRRANFSQRPSRFQSVFGFETAEAAAAFNTGGWSTFLLEAKKSIRLDQTWLRISEQSSIASYSAHKYWSGESSPNPQWELLLAPPVRIVDQLTHK